MKSKLKALVKKISERLSHTSLRSMLILVIAAAMCIVGVAYLLYERNSNRKYDIARPGQHDENKVLSVEDDEADTTSSVTAEVAKDKLERFQKELEALNSLGGFNPEALSDQNIQLAPPDQPSL